METYEGGEELTATLTELAELFVANHDFDATLERVADLCCRTVDHCDEAAITVVIDGAAARIAATGEGARDLERIQHQLSTGPGIEAVRSGEVVRASLLEDERWPSFTAAAEARGLVSCIAAPLPSSGGAVGCLTLYSSDPGGFPAAAETLVQLFASQAAVAVTAAVQQARAANLTEQMQQALQSRATIDIAKGIVMARERCDADAAFAVLVKASQQSNRKLREVAADLVEEASRPLATDAP